MPHLARALASEALGFQAPRVLVQFQLSARKGRSMKKFRCLGYGKSGSKMFFAEAETSRAAWPKMWIEANNRGYILPIGNVVEVA